MNRRPLLSHLNAAGTLGRTQHQIEPTVVVCAALTLAIATLVLRIAITW
jgi:hypothetical protein